MRLTRVCWWIGGLAGIAGLVSQADAGPGNGLYTKAQSARGRIVYAQNCASCHGGNLGGGAAPTLTGAFWATWKGRSMGELLGLVAGSMPADAPASLADEDYANVVAYMLEAGGYPAGSARLPAKPEALGKVKIGARP